MRISDYELRKLIKNEEKFAKMTSENRIKYIDMALQSVGHTYSKFWVNMCINYSLFTEEINYIKSYLIKYDIVEAIYLMSELEEIFLDEEKQYIYCCSIENLAIGYHLLSTINIDKLDEHVLEAIIDNIIEKGSEIKIYNYNNDRIQKYIKEKHAGSLSDFGKRPIDLSPCSLLYKDEVINAITNKNSKKITKFIMGEYFLDFEDEEKMIFHDIYMDEIWNSYCKKKSNLEKYIRSYSKFLFEDELGKILTKMYKRNDTYEIKEFISTLSLTPKLKSEYDSFLIKNKMCEGK